MEDGSKSKDNKLKSFFQKLGILKETVTEEEIISMLDERHENGVLADTEVEMIQNIFDFDDKNAEDIMTHRKNMVGIEKDSTVREAFQVVAEKSFSRYPIYDHDMDHIEGILHIKDAFHYVMAGKDMDQSLQDAKGLIREVRFIPETKSINSLFAEMQQSKEHIVIVVDEYGQTSGMIAMEDLLEEIVGNIFDEHDVEDVLIEPLPDGSYRMKGMAPLEEISELLDLELPLEDYDTLNGFLISQIEKIPKDHEKFQIHYENYLFSVEDVKDRMITRVHVKKESAEEKQADSCQPKEKMVE